jgi:hypothetical protein
MRTYIFLKSINNFVSKVGEEMANNHGKKKIKCVKFIGSA